jgi:flavin-dependent dehydrogenase
MISTNRQSYDAIVLGGGPAGSVAAIELAKAGLSVVVLERTTFPRFHVGESLLPEMMRFVRELGLEERVAAVPHVHKSGAAFVNGDGNDYIAFHFTDSLVADRGADTSAINVERGLFDAALLTGAREAGAEVREGANVRAILELRDGEVRLDVEEKGERYELRADWLLDASGQSTMVGRHLGTRSVIPDMKKVAYFSQFEGVARKPMPEGGFPVIVVCQEGWFWLIPIDERRTSVGFVTDAGTAKRIGVPADGLLPWAIARCPAVAAATADAKRLETRGVTADFSYRCRPYAGPGYFLLGDAATFVDPIFSTGVTLGMGSAREAARHVMRLRRGEESPAAARRGYARTVDRGTAPFFKLVEGYYRPAFRDLLFSGAGPFEMHRAVIAILAGHLFSRSTFGLRWRLASFHLFVVLQRFLPLAPRRRIFALLDDQPGVAN